MLSRLQILLFALPMAVFSMGEDMSKITLTPWCSNSWRVQITPATPPDAAEALHEKLSSYGLQDLPAALIDECGPGAPVTPTPGGSWSNGNLAVSLLANGDLQFKQLDTGLVLLTANSSFAAPSFETSCASGAVGSGGDIFVANMSLEAAAAWCTANKSCAAFTSQVGAETSCEQPLDATTPHLIYFKSHADTNGDAAWKTWTKPALPGYLVASTALSPGNTNERVFGLGQGGWTADGGCPSGPQLVVPLQRNGQTVNLQQRKFHVSIPFVYSTAGYGFLWNMPGYGSVSVQPFGTGGMAWRADAALFLDFWVSGLPAAASNSSPPATAIYTQYADATGHAPPLRPDAMLFWQSRNRYKSSLIALDIARRYGALSLPLGVLVVDYKNQVHDGDFAPDPLCFPSVANLSAGIRALANASTMFSFWPEVLADSAERAVLAQQGCLANADLGGLVVDSTIPACRDLIWNSFLKPRYYDQGVSAYWLDETDGEGTASGYDTSFGPAAAFSQLWVGSWLSTFSSPVSRLGELPPLVLTRGVWAGGQRYGVVLWSSDIWSTFEELASQVPQGVHASLSGIPWWTTDVGGYGCGHNMPNDSPYMQELIVRWHQFGLFCPIYRTHGCRQGQSEPDIAPCVPKQGSCGENEIWSYGNATQVLLESYVRFRADVLLPYIAELARNVSRDGVPTMRPLWWEFPADPACYDVDDQYMLGPSYLVAPVTTQNATQRKMVFPSGAMWVSVWNASVRVQGGVTLTVEAPLSIIPAYRRA